MDTASFGVIATWALPVVACLVALVTTINSTRRVRPDTLRRRVARTVLWTWLFLALLVPVVLLSALGVLPRWTYGTSAGAAFQNIPIASGKLKGVKIAITPFGLRSMYASFSAISEDTASP